MASVASHIINSVIMATLEGLKTQRSNAQREFTKCVNRLERGFDELTEDAIANEQVKLSSLHEELWGATEDYLALLDDIPTDKRETGHDNMVDGVQQKTDGCKHKYDSLMQKLRDTLWITTVAARYGKVKTTLDTDLASAKALGQHATPEQYGIRRDDLSADFAVFSGVVKKWAYSVPKVNGAEMRETLEDYERELKKVMMALTAPLSRVTLGTGQPTPTSSEPAVITSAGPAVLTPAAPGGITPAPAVMGAPSSHAVPSGVPAPSPLAHQAPVLAAPGFVSSDTAQTHCAWTMRAETITVNVPQNGPGQDDAVAQTLAITDAEVLERPEADSDVSQITEDTHSMETHRDPSHLWEENTTTLPSHNDPGRLEFLLEEVTPIPAAGDLKPWVWSDHSGGGEETLLLPKQMGEKRNNTKHHVQWGAVLSGKECNHVEVVEPTRQTQRKTSTVHKQHVSALRGQYRRREAVPDGRGVVRDIKVQTRPCHPSAGPRRGRARCRGKPPFSIGMCGG